MLCSFETVHLIQKMPIAYLQINVYFKSSVQNYILCQDPFLLMPFQVLCLQTHWLFITGWSCFDINTIFFFIAAEASLTFYILPSFQVCRQSWFTLDLLSHQVKVHHVNPHINCFWNPRRIWMISRTFLKPENHVFMRNHNPQEQITNLSLQMQWHVQANFLLDS